MKPLFPAGWNWVWVVRFLVLLPLISSWRFWGKGGLGYGVVFLSPFEGVERSIGSGEPIGGFVIIFRIIYFLVVGLVWLGTNEKQIRIGGFGFVTLVVCAFIGCSGMFGNATLLAVVIVGLLCFSPKMQDISISWQLAVMYLLTGITKLLEPEWRNGIYGLNHLTRSHFEITNEVAALVFGWFIIIAELLFAVCLIVLPWVGWSIRYVIVLCIVLFHCFSSTIGPGNFSPFVYAIAVPAIALVADFAVSKRMVSSWLVLFAVGAVVSGRQLGFEFGYRFLLPALIVVLFALVFMARYSKGYSPDRIDCN
ncbi:MAG: hypothetical protein P1U68_03075 [Verrucomicrobiales bacterium]|nr:hypothetical protein [Verrucomicrobiales bacterium]